MHDSTQTQVVVQNKDFTGFDTVTTTGKTITLFRGKNNDYDLKLRGTYYVCGVSLHESPELGKQTDNGQEGTNTIYTQGNGNRWKQSGRGKQSRTQETDRGGERGGLK